jgi:hypothetical protein
MGILMALGGYCQEKNKAKQSQSTPISVSPQHCCGVENLFEKT